MCEKGLHDLFALFPHHLQTLRRVSPVKTVFSYVLEGFMLDSTEIIKHRLLALLGALFLGGSRCYRWSGCENSDTSRYESMCWFSLY